MQSFDQYHRKDLTLSDTVNELSNPGLDYARDREQVNELVINLVIKYIAAYLKTDDKDFGRLRNEVSTAVQNSPMEVIAFMAAMFAGLDGQSSDALNEKMALQCLCAIRDTSAIFKEIAFNDQFDTGRDFIGVDYGSGTGILMVASLIAARRKRVNDTMILGFDIQQQAVNKSSDVLSRIDPQAFQVKHADVKNPGLHAILRGLPLSHWVSETFGYITPKITVRDDRLVFPTDEKSNAFIDMNANSDPLPFVLAAASGTRPHFIRDVRRKVTAMFPDIVNGQYLPDMDNSTLALRTGSDNEHLRLDKVGREFDGYEDFGLTPRWQYEGDPSQMPVDQEKALELALQLGQRLHEAMKMDR